MTAKDRRMLTGWLAGWLADWLADWPWLTGWLAPAFPGTFLNPNPWHRSAAAARPPPAHPPPPSPSPSPPSQRVPSPTGCIQHFLLTPA
ncbi:hypothetical protein CRUP_031236 [Coryphaenoides rupestris]|nr:hypothetical protein CRUP_031236 [Coryphaenoides rupestris]